MIPSEKARSGISPRDAAKNAAQKGKIEERMRITESGDLHPFL